MWDGAINTSGGFDYYHITLLNLQLRIFNRWSGYLYSQVPTLITSQKALSRLSREFGGSAFFRFRVTVCLISYVFWGAKVFAIQNRVLGLFSPNSGVD